MKLLGIAGSLRAGSFNRQLLQLAADNLPDGVEYAVWDGLRDLPAFDEDEENTGSFAVGAFRSAVAAANAVLIVTPEYNGSIPGALKNALDWGSRPRDSAVFRGKPVAAIGASTGSFGGVWRARRDTQDPRPDGAPGCSIAELSLGKAGERLAEPDDELIGQVRAVVDLLVTEASRAPRRPSCSS